MKIKTIQLKNGYKRFHDITIDLGDAPPRIVALVGPNGCGKSSVFDGILWLVGSQQQIGRDGQKNADFHSMDQDNKVRREDVVVEFDEGEFTKAWQRKAETGKPGTLFSFRSSYRYNTEVKIKDIKANSDIAANNIGAASSAAIDAKMEDSYRRLQAEYRRLVDEDDLTGSQSRNKLIGDLNQSLKRCLDLEITSLGNVEGNQGTLYFSKPDQGKPFEFNVLSSGEKEVVDLLLDLYLRRQEYDETVFIIDEPELHISTAIQRKLIVEINRLIGQKCQLWISTHSIGLLRALQEDLSDECEVIYFDPEMNFGSEPQILKPMRKSQDNWRRIFATALDDLVELVSPRRLIYCEGKAEPKGGREAGLDADVYNQIFGVSHGDTQFVSSGGADELSQRSEIAIKVLSKIFPELEIWVLEDRDYASGHPTTQADRGERLTMMGERHRVLVRREIENYLYDKEVLSAYCASKDVEFDLAAYDNEVGSIEDHPVKDMTGKIKNFCSIKGSVKPDQFKRELAKHVVPGMAVYEELHSCIFGELSQQAKTEAAAD
ncbi:MAG: AAA family ATPase [Hyphomicrobiaceae bacterium]